MKQDRKQKITKYARIAIDRWEKATPEQRRKVLENVFCVKCRGSTEIVEYIQEQVKFGVVLRGKCKKCGNEVARVLEGD